MLTYTVISDWANDVFSLNPQTGVFTLTARLDYEEVSECKRKKKSLPSLLCAIDGSLQIIFFSLFKWIIREINQRLKTHRKRFVTPKIEREKKNILMDTLIIFHEILPHLKFNRFYNFWLRSISLYCASIPWLITTAVWM